VKAIEAEAEVKAKVEAEVKVEAERDRLGTRPEGFCPAVEPGSKAP
jgi:hypothetical protein